jgi:hypothetical protein
MIKMSKVPVIKMDAKVIDNALRKIAMDAHKLIINRTSSGVDVEGNPFTPYSGGYKKAKQRYGLSGEKVNLRSGLRHGSAKHMLNSIKQSKITGGYSLSLPDELMMLRGYYHQTGQGRLPVRHWFGVSMQEGDNLYKKHMTNVNVASFK